MPALVRVFAQGITTLIATATGIGMLVAIFMYVQSITNFFVARGIRGDLAFGLGMIIPIGVVAAIGLTLIELLRPLTRKPKKKRSR